MKYSRKTGLTLGIIALGVLAATTFVCNSWSLVEPVASQTTVREDPPATSRLDDAMKSEEIESISVLRKNRAELLTSVRDALRQMETISQLRKIRSLETMSVVADYLDVHDNLVDPSKKISTRSRESAMFVEEQSYPAVRILEVIGKPALPALQAILGSNEPSSMKFHNAVHVIKFIFRPDPNDAAVYLREQAELAKSESARQNLLVAADKIARNLP